MTRFDDRWEGERVGIVTSQETSRGSLVHRFGGKSGYIVYMTDHVTMYKKLPTRELFLL